MAMLFLDTCNCVINQTGNVLMVKCDSHTTANQALTANQTENLRHGNLPTESQQKDIVNTKYNMKKNSTMTAQEQTKLENLRTLLNTKAATEIKKSDLS